MSTGKLIAALCAVALYTSAAAAQREWTQFTFQKEVDPLTDEVTLFVLSTESRGVRERTVAVACFSDEREGYPLLGVLLQDGEIQFSRDGGSGYVNVHVRFDKYPAEVIEASPTKSGSGAVIRSKGAVDKFLNGLRSNTRLVFKIGQGPTMIVPLEGSTAAMIKMDAACPWLP